MTPDIIHECDLSIVFLFVNVFSSSVFLHWCHNYMLRMDELKSEINIKSCGECVVIHYIFRVMYEKMVFAVMDNKSVSINESRCLILYMNVAILLIKILNTIQNVLPATFVSLSVFMYCAIITLNLPC
jgi:hypothetical protein